MYFEIYKNMFNRQYWFLIKSQGNHQTLATSEMYKRKEGVLHAIQIIASSTEATYVDSTGEV